MSDNRPNPKQSFDVVLKGGHVIDPANNINHPMEIGILDGKISRVAPEIPTGEAVQCLDVSGQTITPGILDIHTHVYPFRPSSKSYVEGLNAEAHLFSAGVTTTADAGTAGWKHFLDFKEGFIDRSRVRILAFLNIARSGMVDAESEQRMSDMDVEITASLARTFPEIIVGIKSAHYWTNQPWDLDHIPWASVERAVAAAEMCGKPVMVDFWPRPPERSYPDLILKKLRPGDIHTHVFAQQFPILTALSPEGKVNDFLFKARERGVYFDLGHGAGSFWFRNAVPAFRDGFPPDTLSTDLHMANINGPVISMLTTMSKFLGIGMPLPEVIQRSTVLPAKLIRRPDLGTLSVGAEADVAVFKLLEGTFGYTDCGRAKIRSQQKLECTLTLRAGKIVYDPNGLSMPDWEQAPEPYWGMPS